VWICKARTQPTGWLQALREEYYPGNTADSQPQWVFHILLSLAMENSCHNTANSQPQWVAHVLLTLAVENCQQQARTKSHLTAFAGAQSCNLQHANTLLCTAQPSLTAIANETFLQTPTCVHDTCSRSYLLYVLVMLCCQS
jgi:hypothetical protein